MKSKTLSNEDSGWWIVSDGRQLWLPEGELPFGTAQSQGLTGKFARHIGDWQGESCWLIQGRKPVAMSSVRQLIGQDPQLFQLAGRGVQLAEFYRSHQWCGYCGAAMNQSKTEFACLCAQCNERYYPQIAPCIIVAIRRGPEILLAHHLRHRTPVYSLLAGFVEAGETLEQTVHREVYEESQLRVTNLRYVTSQPWPFPHSLMTAFMADYISGEIHIDPSELLDAGWYRYDQLPPLLPKPGSVARRLIEDTVALCRQEDNGGTLGGD